MTVFSHAHYAAPCTSVFVLLLVDACRRVFAQYRRVGTALVIAAPVAWIAWQAWELRRPASPNSLSYRPSVENQLTAEPGRHVVFVRYGALHPLGEEWVYNKPDIDRSNVVWARDLGQQANREVVEYYRDRIFWVLEPDHAFPRLSRCAPACADSEPAASN